MTSKSLTPKFGIEVRVLPGLRIEILRQAQDRLWGTQFLCGIKRRETGWRRQVAMKIRDVLLMGLSFALVRGLWSWRTFVHRDGSTLLMNAVLLLTETIVFVAVYVALLQFPKRKAR
jgi:hypothetical protein